MVIHRTSDSLSRCDPSLYSNIYDVRKRSDIKHQPISATQPIHKDTIEISHDKLKEEALNRLRHTTKYVIAQNSFMRIGKYLFLAVAFPPYLMLYGLPKWILVEGLPALFSTFIWMWKKVQQKTQKHIDAGSNKVVQMMQFMQKMAQNVLIQPIVRLALEIRQKIQRMREHAHQFFNQIMERVKTILPLPRFIRVKESAQYLQKKLLQTRKKINDQAQIVTARLQESIQWIKHTPQIILNWGQAQWQLLGKPALSWGRIQWKKRFQTSQQLAERTTNWISNQLKHALGSFKRRLEPFGTFYRQKILPQWNKFKEGCKSKWQQTRDFFHHKHQKALVFVQDKQEKVKHLSYQHLLDRFLSQVWMDKLPSNLQAWLKKWLSHPIVYSICDRIIKIYASCTHLILRASSQVLQLLSRATRLVFKTYQSLQIRVKIFSTKILNILESVRKVSHKFVFYGIYYSLLCVMITAILFVWGVRALGELMTSLISKLSFKIRPHLNS
jgi:hypothetical protein